MIHCRAATQASLADLSDRDRAVQKVHAKLSGGLRRCGDQKEKRLEGCLGKVRVECLTCDTTWFMIDLLIARTPIIPCFEKVGRHQSQRAGYSYFVAANTWSPRNLQNHWAGICYRCHEQSSYEGELMKPQPTLLI